MKTILLFAALLISVTTTAQLTKSALTSERVARTINGIELKRIVSEQDTSYFMVFKNMEYRALNDSRTLHTGSKENTKEFFGALLEVLDTAKLNDMYSYEQPDVLIIRKSANLIIKTETHIWFYLARSNINLFLNNM